MSLTIRQALREIWEAGVAAVDSARLVRQSIIQHTGCQLTIAGETIELTKTGRLLVLGGGKAGAGMAAGLEAALDPQLVAEKLVGWVNVPADCVRPLQRIHLHAGRPAGVNEPTAAGVLGTAKILELTSGMTHCDYLIVLLSGGGSALLPAPIDGVSLEDKQAVTQQLMHAGASIEQLNAVRSCLSKIKAGNWLRAMPAGRGTALIISDVIGDPLTVIASGPTVPMSSDPQCAAKILQELLAPSPLRDRITQRLAALPRPSIAMDSCIPFRNVIIGNNRTTVLAAAQKAKQLGYRVAQQDCDQRGIASEFGRQFAESCLRWRARLAAGERICLISGGEPTVKLTATDQPRKGGRNQELVLAAAARLWQESTEGMGILSGGTDGEDGPTDAAGAFLDSDTHATAKAQGLIPDSFLAINNSYPFFEQCDGLLKSGPTHTNVMDLRVALIEAAE